MTAANPRMLTVFDTQADEVGTVALADLANDIRRYQVLGPADDAGITADPAPRVGTR